MSVTKEAFTSSERPERVYYAPGVFLDAEDLLAEQTYHRGRLARVLSYLHGWGTAAGLRIEYRATDDELVVHPGIALDRLGRLIEVPKRACIRLTSWVQWLHDQAGDAGGEVTASQLTQATVGSDLVVDLFLRFAVCERGRTPAFALGPYDAVDASVPHRLRDSYELSLELRGGNAAALPTPAWTPQGADTFEAWMANLHEDMLDAWRHGDGGLEDELPDPPVAQADLADPFSVFLGRVSVPITTSVEDPLPLRDAGTAPTWDESARRFVYSNDLIAFMLSQLHATP